MGILNFVKRIWYRSTSYCDNCGVEITRNPCWNCGR